MKTRFSYHQKNKSQALVLQVESRNGPVDASTLRVYRVTARQLRTSERVRVGRNSILIATPEALAAQIEGGVVTEIPAIQP